MVFLNIAYAIDFFSLIRLLIGHMDNSVLIVLLWITIY